MLLEEDDTDHKTSLPIKNSCISMPVQKNNILGKHILSMDAKPFAVDFSPGKGGE